MLKYKQFTRTMRVKPILFDVSLRDGIQGADPSQYNTATKKSIFSDIRIKYAPPKMEIGSFVSPKVLPIMSDSADIFEFCAKKIKEEEFPPDLYALVPNKKGLLDAIRFGARHFSFITSVSNEFQHKNTRRTLDYKKTEIKEMMDMLASSRPNSYTKLYVSCINECPITGSIDRDFIIYEILSSYGLIDYEGDSIFNEICLSDTMGTLKSRDFEYIVDGLLRFGLANNRISVHLHIGQDNVVDAKRILFACFKRGINRFDVSAIKEGGCSVSMDRANLKPNMTYEFFYETLAEYNTDV